MAIHVFKFAKQQQAFEAGDVLFRTGDAASVMYAVLEGAVELSVAGTVVERVGPGDVFGEIGLLEHEPRTADAVAVEPTVVAVVGEDHFTFLVQEHPTFALDLMRVMARRLRRNAEHGVPSPPTA